MKAQAAHARFFYVGSLGLLIQGLVNDRPWLMLVSTIVLGTAWFFDIDGERERVDREEKMQRPQYALQNAPIRQLDDLLTDLDRARKERDGAA